MGRGAGAVGASRRRLRAAEQWTTEDTSWQKRARCFVCRRGFVCNNYADRKVRVKRIQGAIVCAWCRHHPSIDLIVELMLAMPKKKLKKHMKLKRQNYG